MAQKLEEKCSCGGTYVWSNYCAAHVCTKCNKHKGLAKCFCGWPKGEHLEDDTGNYTWNGETWVGEY